MTDEELKRALIAALQEVAPEAEPEDVPGDADLREELDLDSMDFLNFAIAVNEALGVEIPEADYPRMTTFDGAIAYLQAKLAEAGG